MIAEMRQISSLACNANAVLRPAEEYRDLPHVEWPRAVLEHLWNTILVHGWGPLVMGSLGWCYAARMNSLGW